MHGDGIFKRKDRNGYFLSWIDAQGQRRKRKAKGVTLGEARAQLDAERTRVWTARVLGFSPPTKDSFTGFVTRYLIHQKPRLTPKEYERQSQIAENHLRAFFTAKVAEIRRADVQRYVTERSNRVGPASVRKELSVLKHMLNLAVSEWEIIPVNPAQGVKSPKVPPGRVRYLQPTELRVVLEACPEWLRPIVAVAVCTGMRRGEILGLRWLDLDMAHHHILLPQTKNGDGRVVYLNQSALVVLRSLPFGANTKSTDRLFPDQSPGQVTVAFRRACRSVHIADFRFHDLRHTAASWLRMSGADIHTVAELLGHKDLRMAARYQHLSPAFLGEAVSRLDSVFGLLSPPGVPKPKTLLERKELSSIE